MVASPFSESRGNFWADCATIHDLPDQPAIPSNEQLFAHGPFPAEKFWHRRLDWVTAPMGRGKWESPVRAIIREVVLSPDED
jgi:hypothetical protein